MYFKFLRHLLRYIGILLIANGMILLQGCGYSSKTEVIFKQPLNKPALYAVSCGDPSFEVCLTASSNDSRAIPLYEFYQDGKAIRTSADNYLKIVGLKPDTQYSFTVASRDNGGHVSPLSDEVSLKTAETPTKPTLKAVQCGNLLKEICLTASSAVSIVEQYEFFMGNDSVGLSASGSLKITGLQPDMNYSFTARSKDRYQRVSPLSDVVSAKTSTPSNFAITGKNQIAKLNSDINAYFVVSADTPVSNNLNTLYNIQTTPYRSVCTLSGTDISCQLQIPENSAGYLILLSGLCGNQIAEVNDYASAAVPVAPGNSVAVINLDRQYFVFGSERFCMAF